MILIVLNWELLSYILFVEITVVISASFVLVVIVLVVTESVVLDACEAVPLGVAGCFIHFVFVLERVALFECDELVEVDQTVEERAGQVEVLAEVGFREDHFLGGFDHVGHLAHDVFEDHTLVVQLLHASLLFGLEEVHLLGADQVVFVQVDYLEPVVERAQVGFVFLR